MFLFCSFRTKLLRANVHFLSQPVVEGTTGTVIVLTTPDAQRTMLSYQVRIVRPCFFTVHRELIMLSRFLVSYLCPVSVHQFESPNEDINTCVSLSRGCPLL